MADFNSRKKRNLNQSPKKYDFSVLPWLYTGELLESCLKTYFHNRSGQFQDKFHWKTYLGFTALHKICFHPLRILFEDFSNNMFCSGIAKAGFWRQLLAGFVPAAFSSLILQFLDQLKYGRAISVPTLDTPNIIKHYHIGLLYGLSRANEVAYALVRNKLGINIQFNHFMALYFGSLVGFDHLICTYIYKKNYDLKGSLLISATRVGVSFLAHNIKQLQQQ